MALAMWAPAAMPAETFAKDDGASGDAAFASPIGGIASAGSFAPNVNLIFSLSEATQAPTIDGKLDPPVPGHERLYEFWGALKPTTQLRLDFNDVNARMTETASGPELYSGYIARNKLTYQFTKRLFPRLVSQYNDFSKSLDVDPLLSYKINPFTVFYLGSTHDIEDFGEDGGYIQTKRQFFAKLQYLFRV